MKFINQTSQYKTARVSAKTYTHIFTALPLAAAMLCSPSAFAKPNVGNLKAKFESMASAGTKVSAEVLNLSTGEKVFQFNSGTVLNPASAIKLFTAYTALKELGPAYTFKTDVFVKPDQGICIRGGGDPSFVMEDMYLLVDRLRRKGVESYSGQVTLDSSVFDDELYPEDRTDQNSERAYNAPIAGLNFNYNTISVFVNPKIKGEAATVGLDFPFDFVKVQGKVTTGTSTEVSWDKTGKDEQEIVHLGGKIAVGAEEWRKPFRIRNPSAAFGEALTKQLEMAGISAKGKVSTLKGSCGMGDPTFSYESKPLSYVVQLMDKYSNNFIADSLVKILDHETNHKQGTATGGLRVVRAKIKSLGVDLDSNGRNFVSGSGLTRDNKVSAGDFTSLLKHIYDEKLELPEFLTSLPIASLDGTLKRKYKNTPAALRLRAKTGTLDNVMGLVGVYPNVAGQYLAVAVLVNGARPIPESELGEFLGNQ